MSNEHVLVIVFTLTNNKNLICFCLPLRLCSEGYTSVCWLVTVSGFCALSSFKGSL